MNSTFDAEKVSQHIVNWLKEYAQKAHAKGFVIGISGGIDSAVTSYLCALTGLPVICVTLPIHQPANQMNHANAHSKMLQSKFNNVAEAETDLTAVCETMKNLVPPTTDEHKRNLTIANTRPRLLMTPLYY